MTTRLAVLLDGAHVADVERTRSGVLRLTYHDDLAPGATPLSLALPPPSGGASPARPSRPGCGVSCRRARRPAPPSAAPTAPTRGIR